MKNGNFVHSFLLALTLVLTSLGFGSAAAAQNPYSAAVLVNGRIISHYDISQRQRLLGALGTDVTLAEAREQLIDDQLKVQTAEIFGLGIADDELGTAIDALAESNGSTGEQLWARASSRGVARPAFEFYFKAQLYWRRVVQARYATQGVPNNREIDEALLSLSAPPAQVSYQIGEIALPFEERGEAETLAFARRLSADLNAGADFATAVRNFSRSRTAQSGGVIGWVDPNRLPPAIEPHLRNLRVGQVSQPIVVGAGVLILKILDQRAASSPLRKEIALTYAVLDLSGRANAPALADDMLPGIDECSARNSHAAEFVGGSGKFGPVAPAQVPADIGLVLARLADTEAQVLTSGSQVRIVQLCDREISINEDIRNTFAGQLANRKVATFANGYLLELRRIAVIESK